MHYINVWKCCSCLSKWLGSVCVGSQLVAGKMKMYFFCFECMCVFAESQPLSTCSFCCLKKWREHFKSAIFTTVTDSHCNATSKWKKNCSSDSSKVFHKIALKMFFRIVLKGVLPGVLLYHNYGILLIFLCVLVYCLNNVFEVEYSACRLEIKIGTIIGKRGHHIKKKFIEKKLRLLWKQGDVKKYKQRSFIIVFSRFTANFLVCCKFTAWHECAHTTCALPALLYTLQQMWLTFQCLLVHHFSHSSWETPSAFSVFLALRFILFTSRKCVLFYKSAHELISPLLQLLRYKILQSM